MHEEISILIRCYEYTKYTRNTINSILDTAKSNYSLIISPNKASAAVNSNLLIEKAITEYMIIMDDDLEFTQVGWDVMLMKSLLSNPKIGCIAPRLLDGLGKRLNAQSDVPDGKIMAGIKTSGAIFCFKDIGIRYDENYEKTQYDDTDFAYQFIQNGLLVAIDGSVIVKHMKPATSTQTIFGKRNAAYFKKKWKISDHAGWGPMMEL